MREALSALLISESCFIFLAIPNRSSHGPLRKCVRFLQLFGSEFGYRKAGLANITCKILQLVYHGWLHFKQIVRE